MTSSYGLADTLDLDSIRSVTDTTFRTLCHKLSWGPEEIMDCIVQGQAAREQGVCREVARRIHTLIPRRPSFKIAILPPVSSDWDEFEYTVPRMAQPSHTRFQSFPRCHLPTNTSCANMVLFVAIHSGAGIRRCDAMGFASLRALAAPQQLLRGVLALDWGDCERQLYAQMLDSELRMELQAPEFGAIDIVRAIPACFGGLQSFTFTTLPGFICCGDRIRVPDGVCPSSFSMIPIKISSGTSESVQELCNKFFSPELETHTAPCGMKHCLGIRRGYYKHIVADRLPPWLSIGLQPGINVEIGSASRLQSLMEVKFRSTKRVMSKLYRLAGVVYGVGSERMIARWSSIGAQKESWIEYDDHWPRNQSIRRVLNGFDALSLKSRGASIRAAFYKQEMV
jgi:hypothetical protein